MSNLGITINLTNKAISQYGEVSFDSMCIFNGKLLGCNGNGIFERGGDLDVAAVINARFRTASIDLGSERSKAFRLTTVSGLSEGNLEIYPVVDNDLGDASTCDKLGSDDVRSITLGMDGSKDGRYVAVEIRNVNGGDFSINSIEALLGVLTQKHNAGRAFVGRMNIKQKMKTEISASGTAG